MISNLEHKIDFLQKRPNILQFSVKMYCSLETVEKVMQINIILYFVVLYNWIFAGDNHHSHDHPRDAEHCGWLPRAVPGGKHLLDCGT